MAVGANRRWHGHPSRRAVLRGSALGLAGVAGAALIGCSDDDEPSSSPTGTAAPGETGTTTPDATSTSPDQPRSGGTARWGLPADLTALEPHLFSTNHYDSIWQAWERLVEFSVDYEVQGRLAESWEAADDATEFVFHLRPGVTWHSGREFTSEDVAYNLERASDPNTGVGHLAPMGQWFDSVETPDENTVILGSSTPRPTAWDYFAYLNIGDPESLEVPEITTIQGTGPFMFAEWRPGDQLRMVKNPNYWDAGLPYLDEQVFSVSLDPQAMISQLEAGALDIAQGPPLRDLARLREDSNFKTLTHATSGSYYVAGFNTSIQPFDDVRVRQALNWAIDRERFADTLLLGTVEPYSLPWPEGSIAYDADKVNHYTFDPEKARQLLDAAGISSLDFEVMLNPNLTELIEFAEIYQEDVAQLGLTLTIDVREVASWVERANAQPPQYNGMYMANSARSNLSAPVTMITLGTPVWGYQGVNNTWYSSEAYTSTVESLIVESNPERQRELYSQLNDILLEDSFLALMAPRPPQLAMSSSMNGVRSHTILEGFEMREAWLS